jgi:large repetitive protein
MMKKAQFLTLVLCALANTAFGASDVSVRGGLSKGGKLSGTNPKIFTPTKSPAVVGKGAIQSALNGGKGFTVRTESAALGNGDLTVEVPVAKKKGKNSTLTLNAVRDLAVNGAISSSKNAVPLVLSAGGAMSSSAAISTNGGDVTVNTVEPFTLGAALSAGAGKVLVQTGTVQSDAAQTVTASSVEVAEGAAWHLQGTVAGNLNVAGEVSPGLLGTTSVQVNGAITLAQSATTAINLAGTSGGSNHGRITASGVAIIAGKLQVDFVNLFEDAIVNGHTFTILSAASIIGTFDGLPNDSRLVLPDELGTVKVTYTTTSVILSDWKPIIVDLQWDPGTEDAGTFIYTNARPRGRRHFFRVHSQVTDIGAWRSRLTMALDGGEADLYMSLGSLPTTNSYQYRSKRVGADGFVLNKDQFAASQEWFLLVDADPDRAWSIFSGRAFVQDLGLLPWTDSNASGTYDIGEAVQPSGSGPVSIEGEGMRFFKAAVPTGTPAWSLWLSGSTKDIAVKKSAVPFHTSQTYYDRKQSGQMLVVPPYLGATTATYFLSVVGNPGDSVTLDSRIQEVTDIEFDSEVPDVSVPDAPYRVYRVQVPVQEIAWDVSTQALMGDPNVAVRRASVPAEFDNDAFSEVEGSVSDSITLVPNFLTNGTWFITVYGRSAYSFTLRSGPPVITPLQFTDMKVNDQPFRVGWRFYALTDIPTQLGAVGWELELANHVPGTEIAIRRNAVPSRWRNRINGLPNITKSAAVDFSGSGGFLQRPGHQADIWYVGVYMPTAVLGAFELSCKPITPPEIVFDGGTRTVSALEPGRFGYVRVDVPAGAVGWDVRVRDVSGPNPAITVRRDLPPAENENPPPGRIPSGWAPWTVGSWLSGNQALGGIDWTGYSLDTGAIPAPARHVMGMGRPLEPGTYYVGVYNTSTTATTSYTVDSRGIGAGLTYPVTSLDYDGGTATITGLAPREARYFKVTVPPNSASWELTLDATAGEVEMAVRRGGVPDFAAASGGNIYSDSPHGFEIEMQKLGPERYVLLPPLGASIIPEGDYYIAVVGEGLAPVGQTIGTGTSSALLRSEGPLEITDIGTATPEGSVQPVTLVPAFTTILP